MTLATTDTSRALQLAESRTITSREIDQRKANLEVAKAQQLAAEAALRNAELNLDWTQVRAPIPGRVSDRRVDAGNLIGFQRLAIKRKHYQLGQVDELVRNARPA